MKRTLFLLLSLMLMEGFAYAQNSDFEEDDYFSDDASFSSAFEDPFSAYESVQLCLPLHFFPGDGTFAPYLAGDRVEEMYLGGVRYERHIRAQESLDGVGPLNPLITELDIQGVHGDGQDAPIILFAPIEAFYGQLDAVAGARMRVVGPVTFSEKAYAVVPIGRIYDEKVKAFRGTLIRYDPNEMTARDALNQWLLRDGGWYLVEGEQGGRAQIVDDGGEVLTDYDLSELNRFWAESYELRQEVHEDSVFAKIEILVQQVFWRFYGVPCPGEDVGALWVELDAILEELIEEEEWGYLSLEYLANYRRILSIWYQAFEERGLLRSIYVPPPVYAAAVESAITAIDALLESQVEPFLWPTGRVTVVANPVPMGEWTPVASEFAMGALSPLDVRERDQYIEALLEDIAPYTALRTLSGATECWF